MTHHIDVVPPPEHFEIDFDEVGTWVGEEMNRVHEQYLEDIRAEVELEQELNAPIIARSHDLGLIIEDDHSAALESLMLKRSERREAELEELGVLRQPMPIRFRTVCDSKGRPYQKEHEEDDGSSGSSSFADKVSGDMIAKTTAHYDGSTNWARCSIGQWFVAKNYGGFVHAVISDRGSATALWGTFGVSSRIEMMLSLFMFNATQKSTWVKRETVFSASRGQPSIVGPPITPALIVEDGRHFGSFDPGDKILATVMMTAYAVAPLGFASINFRGRLEALSLCHEVP